MFTSPGAARQPRTTEPRPRVSALRLAIVAPAPPARDVLLNRLLRVAIVLLALTSAVLLVASVLLS